MKTPYLVFAFTIYSTWIMGFSSCTLLTTCEGENLQSCVTKAESILQNTNMTFPDDNNTLQIVCSMWDDMTTCMQNFTKRCLTYRENLEFQQYFEDPMRSMKTVCFDQESTREYFRHANCIKKISTGERYCGKQYHLMINQILNVNINTMKKICCALADFKDCVMKININHVCGGGPEETHPNDGASARYALKTLDKSLLAFVAHSCNQEGFYRPGKCKDDEEPRNDLGYLREARTEPPETTERTYPRTTNDLEGSATMTFTLKPLLVPLPGRPEASIHVNITNTGDSGVSSKPGFLPPKIKSEKDPRRPKGFSDNQRIATHDKIQSDLNTTTSFREKINSTEKWTSQLVDDVLAAKVRNASLKFQNPLTLNNRTIIGNTTTVPRRIDSGGSSKGVPALGNSSVSSGNSNVRVGGGRSINFLDSNQQEGAEENKIKQKIIYNNSTTGIITKPTAIIGSNINGNFAIPSLGGSSTTAKTTFPANKGVYTLKTTSTTAAATTSVSTTSSSSTTTTSSTGTTSRPDGVSETPIKTKTPRILNNGNANGNMLRDLNRILGLAPPSTTPSQRRIDIKSRKNQPEALNLSNSTKTDESKNSGNYSVSEVPIKVFMVWLSTFFV